jgi:predicted GNAT family acetyltransferase
MSEYLVDVEGEIFQVTDDGAEERAGSVHAYVVQADRALEAGESIWEVCDDTGDGLEDLCGGVFEDDGELRREVSDGSRGNDVLFLRHADVLTGHRGKGLGLAAVLRIIEDFGRGCAIAVMKPFPLQLVGAEDDGGDAEHTSAYRKSLGLEGFEPDAARARTRLEQYWAKLGFRRIDASELFVLDLGFERPSYDDLFGA